MAIGNCFITHLQILISCFQDNQDSEDVHGFIQGQKHGMYRRVAIGHYDPYPWKITLQSPLALNWMQSNYNTASLIRPKRKVSFSKPKPCENFPLSPRVEQTDDPGPKLKTLGNPAWDGLIGMLTQMIWRLVDQPDLTERGNFVYIFAILRNEWPDILTACTSTILLALKYYCKNLQQMRSEELALKRCGQLFLRLTLLIEYSFPFQTQIYGRRVLKWITQCDLLKFALVKLLVFAPFFNTQKIVKLFCACVISRSPDLMSIGSAYFWLH